MLIMYRILLPATLLVGLLIADIASAQPPPWGSRDGGSSYGYRGPDSFRGGGPPGGYFGGGFPGGGFPGGGFPGGGYSGGGFNPADMVRRADSNNNNMIEPSEFQNGWGRMVQRMAERAGLNTNQPVRVDQLIAAVDPSRSSSSSSSGSGTTAANPQSFSAQTQVALVPGFDSAPGTTAAVGGTTTAAQSNLPLEKRFDERILERAKDRIREYDRNGNGTLEGEELANYRGDPPILTNDVNKDGVISLEEMCLRYQARYSSSSGGPGGFPFGMGGPGGPSGFPGGGFPGGGYPSSSSYSSSSNSSSYRSPSSSPTSSPSSSSTSSSSSSNDRYKEFAQRILSMNDRNNSGKLEKDEWSGLRDGGENTDTNKDNIITVDELAARMASRMSDRGGDRGPGDRGFGDRGPGGFGDRGPGGWGGGPPGFGDRGPGGFGDRGPGGFGDRGPGGFGDRGSYGDRGSDRGGSDRDRGGSDRGGSDRGGSDRGGSDRGGSDRGGSDRGGSDRYSSRDRGSDGRGSGSGSYSGSSSNGSSSNGSGDSAAPKTSYRVSTAAELLPKGLDSWFTRSDTDGDGQVSMSEYAAKWDADVAKKFQQLDANGDGFITADEALRSAPSSRR